MQPTVGLQRTEAYGRSVRLPVAKACGNTMEYLHNPAEGTRHRRGGFMRGSPLLLSPFVGEASLTPPPPFFLFFLFLLFLFPSCQRSCRPEEQEDIHLSCFLSFFLFSFLVFLCFLRAREPGNPSRLCFRGRSHRFVLFACFCCVLYFACLCAPGAQLERWPAPHLLPICPQVFLRGRITSAMVRSTTNPYMMCSLPSW